MDRDRNKYRCVYAHTLYIQIYFVALSAEKVCNTPTVRGTPNTQFLISNTILQQKEPGILEKWLIIGLGRKYTR